MTTTPGFIPPPVVPLIPGGANGIVGTGGVLGGMAAGAAAGARAGAAFGPKGMLAGGLLGGLLVPLLFPLPLNPGTMPPGLDPGLNPPETEPEGEPGELPEGGPYEFPPPPGHVPGTVYWWYVNVKKRFVQPFIKGCNGNTDLQPMTSYSRDDQVAFIAQSIRFSLKTARQEWRCSGGDGLGASTLLWIGEQLNAEGQWVPAVPTSSIWYGWDGFWSSNNGDEDSLHSLIINYIKRGPEIQPLPQPQPVPKPRPLPIPLIPLPNPDPKTVPVPQPDPQPQPEPLEVPSPNNPTAPPITIPKTPKAPPVEVPVEPPETEPVTPPEPKIPPPITEPIPQVPPIREPVPEPIIEPTPDPPPIPDPYPPPVTDPEPSDPTRPGETPVAPPIPIPYPPPLLPPIEPVPDTPDPPLDTDNGELQPQPPQTQPITPPNVHFPVPGAPPVTDGGVRPDLTSIAAEVGRIEQKVARIQNPGGIGDLSDILQLLLTLLSFFEPPVEGTTYSLTGVCESVEEGQPQPVAEWEVPGGDKFSSIINRVDALLPVLQQHLAYRTPTCREQPPQGEWRTIHFISDEPNGAHGDRVLKRFRYRSLSFGSLDSLVDHWAGFTWSAGPVIVKHKGGPWGTPQVWASSGDEGKRVIRHAAAEAGIDPDQVGRWEIGGTSHPRYGLPGTMRVNTKGGYYWITARDGASARPMVATAPPDL